MTTAHIALADGLVLRGTTLAEHPCVVTGELVFSTAMTGYTEILTDPSYYGQIVVLANPEIGNYGVNIDDFQSDGIKIKALVVRQLSSCASSYRSNLTLRDWLLRENIPVVMGVDTRALITHIREKGAMMAALACQRTISLPQLIEKAQAALPMSNKKLSGFVAVQKAKTYVKGNPALHVVVLDFGIKQSIVRHLLNHGARVSLLPGDTSPEEIWAQKPDGLFLSNGPGDPNTETKAIETVRACLGKLPIFGVCLGHQILAQALGYETYKLKFGHRGSNQAVKCRDGRIITTAQNHGFAVAIAPDNLVADGINISDGTNEGIGAQERNAFSVQFHPEGAPGPLDAAFYFEHFIRLMDSHKRTVQKTQASGLENTNL